MKFTQLFKDWDILRLDDTAHLLQPSPRILPAPTPIHPAPLPLPTQTLPPVSVTEFYVDSFHSPAGYPANVAPNYSHSPHHGVGVVYQQHQEPYQPHATYQQQLSHPSFAYTSFVTDPNKRHTVRSPVSGKFVRTGPLVPQKRHDMTKPYDPKKSVWISDDEGGFHEGLLHSDDGKKAVVMVGHEVIV